MFEFFKCSSDEMSSLLCLFGRTNIYLRYSISNEFLYCPRCFLLIQCINSWFLFIYFSSFNVFFKIANGPFEDRGEVKFVCGPRIWPLCSKKSIGVYMYCKWGQFKIELESIILRFWRYLQLLLFLPFHLYRVENCYKDSSTNFCQNILILSCGPVPLTES